MKFNDRQKLKVLKLAFDLMRIKKKEKEFITTLDLYRKVHNGLDTRFHKPVYLERY